MRIFAELFPMGLIKVNVLSYDDNVQRTKNENFAG